MYAGFADTIDQLCKNPLNLSDKHRLKKSLYATQLSYNDHRIYGLLSIRDLKSPWQKSK